MQRSSDEFQKSDKTKIPAFLQILGFVENPLKFFFEKKYIFFPSTLVERNFIKNFLQIPFWLISKWSILRKKSMGELSKTESPKNPDSIQKLLEEITGLEANISVIKTHQAANQAIANIGQVTSGIALIDAAIIPANQATHL